MVASKVVFVNHRKRLQKILHVVQEYSPEIFPCLMIKLNILISLQNKIEFNNLIHFGLHAEFSRLDY